MNNLYSGFNARNEFCLNVDKLNLNELDVLKRVAPVLDIDINKNNGIALFTEKSTDDSITVEFDAIDNIMRIKYFDLRSFARALSHLREVRETGKAVHEKVQFEDLGFMVDLSRNAVLTVDSLKLLTNYLAVMGYNTLFLYIEDTYEIDDYPYFGYQRGAYSSQELKEIDDYAYSLGIEVIPCMQTLGHLRNAFIWPYANEIKDTDDVLLVGEEKTYDFIRSMLRTLSNSVRSRRIHIGMDETFGLGRGNYQTRNGAEAPHEIFGKHIERVLEIAKEFDYDPMVWSDMYFRFISSTNNYYDLNTEITEDIKKVVPNEVSLVYWDYYNTNEEIYEKMLERHKLLGGNKTWFAGGIWNWNGIKVNHGKMFATSQPALEACRKAGIKHILTTAWGDNGSETSVFEALLGAQYFGEATWQEQLPTRSETIRRFNLTVGGDGKAYYNMRLFDEVPGVPKDNLVCYNPSKYILYSDVLTGLFDVHINPYAEELSEHYGNLADYFDLKAAETTDQHRLFYLQSAQLADVLQRKVVLTSTLRASYLAGDKSTLRQLVEFDLPELIGAVTDLQAFTMSIWYLHNKPQGSEVIDSRMGVLIARLKTTLDRVDGYLNGIYEFLPELESKRLAFDGRSLAEVEVSPHTRVNDWKRIISASPISNAP